MQPTSWPYQGSAILILARRRGLAACNECCNARTQCRLTESFDSRSSTAIHVPVAEELTLEGFQVRWLNCRAKRTPVTGEFHCAYSESGGDGCRTPFLAEGRRRPALLTAWRRRNSTWPLRLRSSSSAHFWRASWSRGSILSRKAFLLANLVV